MAFFPADNTAIAAHNRRNQCGNSIIEFALVAPMLMILFFGTIGLGILLGRHIQCLSVARDIAHMYVDGIDFTQASNQSLAVRLAQGTGMTATGGNGVVILSRIITVYQADCDAAGYTSTCTNLNQCVFVQRVAFGNTTLRSSSFGTPTLTLMNAQGNLSASVYLQNTDSSVRTSGLSGILIAAGMTNLIPQGTSTWVTEVFLNNPDVSYLGNTTTGGNYARFIF